ncbi:MAG TPA: ATP synthase F1 subunit gamma [Minicystis sp.]|nr:ATP synthase F1 subunit gamma [Minicystis sp.]
MPSLKAIRKRISSVQSTQKITRAMKMVAGARLNRAQQRITELRPYAVKTQSVLAGIAAEAVAAAGPIDEGGEPAAAPSAEPESAPEAAPALPTKRPSPLELLTPRAEKRALLLVLTSDRGLCGAFNTNINTRAEREWRGRTTDGQEVKLMVVGRKGRDYLTRRSAPVASYFAGVWDKLGLEAAQDIGQKLLEPFYKREVDSVYLVYNEFKSAMSQNVVVERLLPVPPAARELDEDESGLRPTMEYGFEPTREALLTRLIPMYVDISILRALYESQASELGARMTAMDAATKNAKEMIGTLTLAYNKARQAAITKELMEIIGGSEALKE